MNKLAVSSALLGGIFAAMLITAPASAQATRTWVSGVGDDANPCSRTAPCKTFAGAISKTAGGGEINVLDPGGFGGVTITKSITLRSTFEAGVLVSGTNAIVIAAGVNDTVILEGLDIEGLATGLNGIQVSGNVKSVYVLRCSINRFTQSGINFISPTANARLIVKDTTIINNNAGINVQNGGSGLSAAVLNSLIDGNGTGMQANGGTTSISYAYSTIAGGITPLNALNGGVIASIGVSNTVGSSVVSSGSPTQFVPFK